MQEHPVYSSPAQCCFISVKSLWRPFWFRESECSSYKLQLAFAVKEQSAVVKKMALTEIFILFDLTAINI